MKRKGYIYEAVCDLDNLKHAIRMAAKRKRSNPAAAHALANIDAAATELRRLLVNREFKPSPYFVEVIRDGVVGKDREIHKPKFFPDQCIHWAIMLQIQPLIMRGMYDWSCGSIPGRGLSRCKQGVERWLRTDPAGTKYCLKLDVSKFYQSVDQDILKAALRRIIKDPDALAVLDMIIGSVDHGLPIGNYTSQWLANFYMQDVDHFIKEALGVQYYARYVDDLVLFGANKKQLHAARKRLFAYIETRKRLRIKGNWQLFMVTRTRTKGGRTYMAGRDVDFLGYRMNHDITTIRRRTSLRIMRRARKISRKTRPTIRDAQAMVSYFGIIKHCDSYRFLHGRIKPYVSISKMKGVISRWQRRQATARRTPDSRSSATSSTLNCATLHSTATTAPRTTRMPRANPSTSSASTV